MVRAASSLAPANRFVVKRIKRGQPLFVRCRGVSRKRPADVGVMSVGLGTTALRHRALVIRRSVSFLRSRNINWSARLERASWRCRRRPTSLRSSAAAMVVNLREDWTTDAGTFPQGSLVSIDHAAASATPERPQARR
jgi:prolyl oligopeptidase PreP (S9A serine peptidase family)